MSARDPYEPRRAAPYQPREGQNARTRDGRFALYLDHISIPADIWAFRVDGETLHYTNDGICHAIGDGDGPPDSGYHLSRDHHPDDEAVDDFAHLMREKMASSRAKGRDGWFDRHACTDESLAAIFAEHAAKANSGNLVDLATLAMMLHLRAADPAVIPGAIRASDLRTALFATQYWLKMMIDTFDVDPDETRFQLSIHSPDGTVTPVDDVPTLAHQLATNETLLDITAAALCRAGTKKRE